jgi:prepilin-type N-terminal cleavage/methylation domain-containing protein
MNKKLFAFTLIELLVVIAIIGILSGLIVVSMSGVTNKANIAKSQVFSNSLRSSLMLNLVSEYKFDTDVSDSWGNNEGTWNGSLGGSNLTANYRSSSECVSGQCLDFDGTDDYVGCGNDSSFNITSALTVEYWIYIDAYPATNYSNIVSKGYPPNAGSWSASLAMNGAGYFFLRKGDNSGYMYAEASAWTAIPLKTWTHMVHVFDGSKTYGATYENGKIDKQNLSMTSSSIYTSANAVQMGTGTYFNGLLDNVRIYSTAVSGSQIKENYYIGLNNLLLNGNISKSEYIERIGDLTIGQINK